jgi:hypothetical protein
MKYISPRLLPYFTACFSTKLSRGLLMASSSNVRCRVFLIIIMDRDSSASIATRYRLDGPGMESRLGRDFPYLSRPALVPTQPPVKWVPGLFPERKSARV